MSYHIIFFVVYSVCAAFMLISGVTMLPIYSDESLAAFAEITPCEDGVVSHIFENKYIGYDCTIAECAAMSAVCLNASAFGYKAPFYYAEDITEELLKCTYLRKMTNLRRRDASGVHGIRQARDASGVLDENPSRAVYFRKDIAQKRADAAEIVSFTECYPSIRPRLLIPRLKKIMAPWSSNMLYPGTIFAAIMCGISTVMVLAYAIIATCIDRRNNA